jgi:small multidrug resistance pump
MLVTYLLLALAIGSEVVGTVSLRQSDGFTRLFPSIVVVVGYITAFAVLAVVLKRGLSISVAYAIWAGAGVALVAAVGALFLGDKLSAVQIAGLVLVVAGVVALELGASHT